MSGVERFEEMVGTREAAAVATESGGMATTDDVTVSDEAAATGGIMYADEGPYTIDVRHVEAMVGTTREAADGNRLHLIVGTTQYCDTQPTIHNTTNNTQHKIHSCYVISFETFFCI